MSIIYHPGDVVERLAQLELTEEILVNALVQANMYRARMTDHHGFLYRCTVLSGETVAALRDSLVPMGWEKKNDGHYDRVFNPRLKFCIAVASGDEATGDRLQTPSNKSPKGPRTVKAARDNRIADLFPETLHIAEDAPVQTWLLLHCRLKDEIRLELSRPEQFDAAERYVTSWTERIILGTIPLDDSDNMPISMPQAPDLDIIISRKQA
jgi:hypothetical protein